MRVCLLHDKELPVKVEAALALQFFIKRQDKGEFALCTRKNEQVVTNLQTSCNKVVVKPATRRRNKLLRACCYQLVENLLRAHDIRLVGTTCCMEQLVASL